MNTNTEEKHKTTLLIALKNHLNLIKKNSGIRFNMLKVKQ